MPLPDDHFLAAELEALGFPFRAEKREARAGSAQWHWLARQASGGGRDRLGSEVSL